MPSIAFIYHLLQNRKQTIKVQINNPELSLKPEHKYAIQN